MRVSFATPTNTVIYFIAKKKKKNNLKSICLKMKLYILLFKLPAIKGHHKNKTRKNKARLLNANQKL